VKTGVKRYMYVKLVFRKRWSAGNLSLLPYVHAKSDMQIHRPIELTITMELVAVWISYRQYYRTQYKWILKRQIEKTVWWEEKYNGFIKAIHIEPVQQISYRKTQNCEMFMKMLQIYSQHSCFNETGVVSCQNLCMYHNAQTTHNETENCEYCLC
jgi:hypothetical protein